MAPKKRVSKSTPKTVTKRRRITKRKNADHRDADHPIEVTKHWRQGPPGYLTPWQRAHHAGQGDLFAHGITPAKLRNSKRRNPDLEQQAIENRIEFAGHYSGPVGVFAAAGTPDGLSRLGQLAELELSTGAKLFFQDKTKYFLAQDTKHCLHIVSAKPGAQVDNEPGDYGEIKTVEYLERKTHLGDDNNEVIQWVHQLGEISGKRPLLRVDKNGQLRIVGGDYSINWRGIIN